MTGCFDGQAKSGRFIQLAEIDYAEMPHVYAFSEIKLGGTAAAAMKPSLPE